MAKSEKELMKNLEMQGKFVEVEDLVQRNEPVPDDLLGPEPPEPIREAFSWHETRLSIRFSFILKSQKGTHFRGLFPEGLKKGVSIQHKFEDGEVVTRAKAENGLTKAVS